MSSPALESVYAESKAMVERILHWYAATRALRAVSLRYFNAAGASMDAQIGSIETGKLADIIAVDENPTQNVKTLQTVRFVMKDGKVYKQ